MVEYFADEFNKQVGNGVDIRKSAKAMAKLKKQVKRTKEILSANTVAPISVESLYDDRDFRYNDQQISQQGISYMLFMHEDFCSWSYECLFITLHPAFFLLPICAKLYHHTMAPDDHHLKYLFYVPCLRFFSLF